MYLWGTLKGHDNADMPDYVSQLLSLHGCDVSSSLTS